MTKISFLVFSLFRALPITIWLSVLNFTLGASSKFLDELYLFDAALLSSGIAAREVLD